MLGTTLGHYKIDRSLGRGGMGEVYSAVDLKLSRRVALKVLPVTSADQAEARQRFEREAKAVAALNHPNIVTIHSVEEEGGVAFLTMELIEGKTLSELIPKGGMRLDQLLKLAIPLADAVSAAHQQGITHRDLKPANVMVTDDGRVKVLDFGLAKLREQQDAAAETAVDPARGLTSKGSIIGTTQYMSPEQAEGRPVDARSDIFSLGIILYEMATGQRPFRGETHVAVLSSILKDHPPSITELNAEQPRDLAKIVKRCVAKDPDQRYQSGRDLRIELALLKEAADSGELRPVLPQPVVGGGDARWWKLALAGAVAATLIAIGFGVWRFRPAPQEATAPAASQIELTRLTSTGTAGLAAISPDGKWVVHVVVDGAQQSLWMRQVATSSNVQIVEPALVQYRGVTFSPDGNFVYYVAYPRDSIKATLSVIPVLGGPPRPVLDNVDTGVSFARDGQHFVALRGVPSRKEVALLLVSLDGTVEKTLAVSKAPETFSLSKPAWSPDGQAVAVAARSADSSGSFMHVVVVDVATGTVRPVGTRHWAFVGSVAWTAGGQSLLCTADDFSYSGHGQVWQLSLPSGAAQKVTNDLNGYSGVSLSADGHSLVTTEEEQAAHVWVAPVGGDSAGARQITNGRSGDGAYGLAWAPDGSIVYCSSASGRSDLWMLGGNAESGKSLSTGGSPNEYPRVSPDGRSLIFVSNRDGKRRIWRADIDGGNAHPLSPGPDDFAPLFVGPDGRFVLYTGLAAFGEFVLWKIPVAGGSPERLTSASGWPEGLSPDGKQLAVASIANGHLQWRVGILRLESPAELVPLDIAVPLNRTYAYPVYFLPDGKQVTFLDPTLTNVLAMPLDGGQPRPLTTFTSETIFFYALSPDGKRLALSRGTISTDVVLMTHLPGL